MSTLKEQLKKAEKGLEAAKERGSSSVEAYEEKVEQLKKELKKPQPHPDLQFGPLAQSIAIMVALSLAMSVMPLPFEMIPFYKLFSTITTIAVICYVTKTSIIYYGYNQALNKLPKPDDPEKERFRKLTTSKKPRQDLWAHTRSHPSAFLTTKAAAPRLFPFPLGKTRPDATIKDELWWEGGNAPHVGHFNKPKLPQPPAPDPDIMMKRVEASMKREAQENMWKKRIRSIQLLCVIVILSFVNQKIAIACLSYLIYHTISTEIQSMLTPPPDMEQVWRYIDKISMNKNESAPKPTQMTGGMSYLYEKGQTNQEVKELANVPIEMVPPHVLMTTQNHWYVGPGNEMKGEK
ncbi:uncharacterized protein I206_105717 [Kwoniella pini CBS 10737]|uniref:Uncharacterized protein n=1 Tax=Kwoniella pini CBS 10737 TaxID=1296096 RepID=A0A1B9I3G3_9TREE|nr:uncharacterized protein I206_03380 [Kwoniella pini CBS 10737]OCF50064.1 hypothetical protein I206_03380 [Kwoniella pini CBS 10737]